VVNKFPHVSTWGFFLCGILSGVTVGRFRRIGGLWGEFSRDFGKISGLREVQMGLFWGVLGGKGVFFTYFYAFLPFF
jgi:hypothetical protein